MNQVQLIGRIVRDVTLQTVGQDQKKIVRNAIAVNNYRHHDKNGNGGNLCKIMFSRLHETEFLSQKDKNKTAFHSIIAERGFFVKGVFLLP